MDIVEELFKIVVLVVIGGVGLAIRQLLVPLVKEKVEQVKVEAEKSGITISKEEMETIKAIVYPLVESAYRLKLQGKIEDAKERVMVIAKTELSKIGINLSDEALDEIRRACLVEFELTLKELGVQQDE